MDPTKVDLTPPPKPWTGCQASWEETTGSVQGPLYPNRNYKLLQTLVKIFNRCWSQIILPAPLWTGPFPQTHNHLYTHQSVHNRYTVQLIQDWTYTGPLIHILLILKVLLHMWVNITVRVYVTNLRDISNWLSACLQVVQDWLRGNMCHQAKWQF